jgi:ATP/ADP translocase
MRTICQFLLIRQGEGRRSLFFVAFFLLLGVGLAVGKGSADALFIKRYGVEYFPLVYLFLSVHIAFFSLFYAAYVDRMSAEKFFRIIFIVQLVSLAAITSVMHLADFDLVYPLYYIAYAISSELLLLHGAFYIGQNFDTLQAKRLTPLIFAGFQAGMIVGGLVLMFIVPLLGLSNAPLVWLAVVAMSMLLLFLWHRNNGASPFYFHVSKNSTSRFALAVSEVREGIEFTRRSSLLKNASWALFFMVITFYMLSYCAHTIYTQTFDDEQQLAGFFGGLVIATNVGAILVQVLLSNKIIERFGIRKANYIYPVTTILSFVLLLLHPGFYAALFASFNRETIMPAIRAPVRQLFFNVLPDKVKGRARAISVAIVMPLALFSCGVLILLASGLDGITPVVVVGIICAAAYLLFTVRMGRDYIATLLSSMQEKLYLPEDELQYSDDDDKVIEALQRGMASDNADVSLSYARALIKAYPRQAVMLILRRVSQLDVKTADQMLKLIDSKNATRHIDAIEKLMHSGDEHLRATVFSLLVEVHQRKRSSLIKRSLRDPDPRMQVSAIYAVYLYGVESLRGSAFDLWQQMLDTETGNRYACLRLIPLLDGDIVRGKDVLLRKYISLIPQLLHSDDVNRRVSVINSLHSWNGLLPASTAELVLQDIDHESPSVRAAVVGMLQQLVTAPQLDTLIWHALSDGHALVRKAALGVIRSSCNNYIEQCYQWLLENENMTPRAQQALLGELVSGAASYAMLEKIAIVKAEYAAELLCAIERMNDVADKDAALTLLTTVLEERLAQVNDLVLLAMQPLSDAHMLRIIRAGLNSNEQRHKANAIEAVGCIDSEGVLELVGSLVKADCMKVLKLGYGRAFKCYQDVVEWCAALDDNWLSQCGRYALSTVKR